MTGELVAGEFATGGVWRLPLPSLTLPPFDHTNSYLLGTGDDGVLIDCGSDDPAVLDALEAFLNKRGVTRLRALLLTHTHADHDAGAAALKERFGLVVYAHPLEGAHYEALEDGATIYGVRAHHTPGHSPGHLSFEVTGALLVGDLLAAQSSTWVGLPGGDVAAYMASLGRLGQLVVARDIRVLGPGHGPVVTEPLERLDAVRAHRLEREAQVLAALSHPRTLTKLREAVYPELSPEAERAADGSLLALLEKLVREGLAAREENAEHTVGEVLWTLR